MVTSDIVSRHESVVKSSADVFEAFSRSPAGTPPYKPTPTPRSHPRCEDGEGPPISEADSRDRDIRRCRADDAVPTMPRRLSEAGGVGGARASRKASRSAQLARVELVAEVRRHRRSPVVLRLCDGRTVDPLLLAGGIGQDDDLPLLEEDQARQTCPSARPATWRGMPDRCSGSGRGCPRRGDRADAGRRRRAAADLPAPAMRGTRRSASGARCARGRSAKPRRRKRGSVDPGLDLGAAGQAVGQAASRWRGRRSSTRGAELHRAFVEQTRRGLPKATAVSSASIPSGRAASPRRSPSGFGPARSAGPRAGAAGRPPG